MTKYFNPTLQTDRSAYSGNCMAACIATLFPVTLNEVPSLPGEWENWAMDLSDWFAKRLGKWLVPVQVQREMLPIFGDSMLIVSIQLTTGGRHAVIVKRDRVIFDPMMGVVDRKLSFRLNPIFLCIGDIL